jgi:Gram-negative bacterial TonB protein C-terminal
MQSMVLTNSFKLLTFLLFISLSPLFAHRDSSDIQADQMPYFKGCTHLSVGSVEKRNCSNHALVSYISKNLEIPQGSDVTGVVYVSFFITEKGAVENPTILRGLEKNQNDAALDIVKNMPAWEPALMSNNPVRIKMTLPIRFTQKDETVLSNGFLLTWGNLKGNSINKNELLQNLNTSLTVRDENGNLLEINELLFERERSGKFLEAQSNGKISSDMEKMVKKMKAGDVFTVTATVQRKGQFYYVDKVFTIVL